MVINLISRALGICNITAKVYMLFGSSVHTDEVMWKSASTSNGPGRRDTQPKEDESIDKHGKLT